MITTAEPVRSGHSSGRPARGNAVDSGQRTAHHGVMRPTSLRDGLIAVGAARFDLEEFWPSRRSHAYDEFCR